MKIGISPDSFKSSISSINVTHLIEKGIKNFLPFAQTILLQVTVGGE
ncbi:glycerate kinase [Peribacillus butanolivorans]